MKATSRVTSLLGSIGLASVLSACSMGGMFGGSPSGADQQLQNANTTPAEMAAQSAALPAIATECPPIKVRPGLEALFYYGKGKVGSPADLQYQGVIDDKSRNCVVSNGLITVKMGVVGRLLLGPAGNQTKVDLPIRFSVERNGTPIYSQKFEIPVAISAAKQTGDFVKVVDGVNIPYVTGDDVEIYVGFDSGRG